MDTANQVQIQDNALCISHSANALEKGINLTVFQLQTVCKTVRQSGPFNLDIATGLGEATLWIENPPYSAQKFDLVLHLARIRFR